MRGRMHCNHSTRPMRSEDRVTAEEEMKQSMTRKKYHPPRGQRDLFLLQAAARCVHTLSRITYNIYISTLVSLNEVLRD